MSGSGMATKSMFVEEIVTQVSQDSSGGLQERKIYSQLLESYQEMVERGRFFLPDQEPNAKEFVEVYYGVRDRIPQELLNVYKEGSMLTFNGERFLGSQNIVSKLTDSLCYCRHVISDVECQPSGLAGSFFAMVKGELQSTDGRHTLKFSEAFLLMPTPQGSFYVLNDIFHSIQA